MSTFIFFVLAAFVLPGEWEKNLIDKLSNPIHLKATVLIPGEELDLFVTDLDRFGKEGLILFAQKDKVVKYYDLQSGALELFARDGEGPGEFRDGFVSGSVVGDTVVVQEFATRQTKAITKQGRSWIVFETLWLIRSLIPVAGKFVVGMVATPGDKYLDRFHEVKNLSGDSNLLFELRERGQLWEFHGTFYNEDFANERDFDSAVGIKTSLYPIRDTNHYYRLPFKTNSVFQIMDISGQVVRECPIPHPFASEMPKSVAARLKLYQQKNVDFIRDASVDRFGKLHMVLTNIRDAEAELSMRLGVVIDEFGKVEKGFLLDRPVRRFVVSEDGTRYFGIDPNEDAFLEFKVVGGE